MLCGGMFCFAYSCPNPAASTYPITTPMSGPMVSLPMTFVTPSASIRGRMNTIEMNCKVLAPITAFCLMMR